MKPAPNQGFRSDTNYISCHVLQSGDFMPEGLSARELAVLLMDVMNSRNLARLEEVISDNAALDFPGFERIEGRQKIITFLKVLFRKYPRLEFQVHDVIAAGDQACVLWNNSGTNSKGILYANQGITHLRQCNSMIVLISDYFKDTSFIKNV